MKLKTILLQFLALTLIISCDQAKIKKAEETLKTFETAYKSEDLATAVECFPEFCALEGSFRKIDELAIQTAEVKENDQVVITAKSNWKNPMGQLFSYDVTFYLNPIKKEGKDKYIISTTKNFTDFSNSYVFMYALKKKPTMISANDQDKSKFVKENQEDYVNAVNHLRKYIKRHLKISNFTWSSGYYSDYASGSAVVKNETGYTLPSVKYQVSYYDRKDNLITQDVGTVTYNNFTPGQMISFPFFTSAIGNAHQASVSCYVDDETFLQQLATQVQSTN